MVLRSLQLSLMRADHRARKMGIGRAVAFQRRDAVQHEVGNADAFPRDQVHTASLGKIAFRALRVLRQDGVPHRLGEQVTVGEPAGRAPVQSSEERRVGKECVGTGSARWLPSLSKKKKQELYSITTI